MTFLFIRTIKVNRTSVVETRSFNMDRFQSRKMIDRKVFKIAERVFSNLNSLQSRTLLNAKQAEWKEYQSAVANVLAMEG